MDAMVAMDAMGVCECERMLSTPPPCIIVYGVCYRIGEYGVRGCSDRGSYIAPPRGWELHC